MNSVELMDAKAQLKAKALEMIDTCKHEVRMFTDEEQKEYNNITNKIKDLNTELKDLERRLLNNNDEVKAIKSNIKSIKKSMEKRFSLVSAINSIAKNQLMDEVSVAVGDAGKEEMRKAGLSMGGQIQLPMGELRSTVTVTAEGEDVVPTDLYDIMAPLRAKNVLVQAGARFLTGLVGDVD